MSELRRYGMVRGESGAGMFWIGECADGEYVLRADHEAEVAALRVLVARQQAIIRTLEQNGHYDDEEAEALLADPSARSAEEWLREREWQLVRRALEEIEVHAIRLRNEGYEPGASCSKAIGEKLESFAVLEEAAHAE